MNRLFLSLAAAALAVFALNGFAQPPEGDQPRDGDRPRSDDRPRDGERPRGDRGPGDRGPGRGFGGPGGFRMPPSPVMRALDADENGELSAEEIAGATAALKKLDTNGDGKLSGDEIRPQFGGPGGPGAGRFDPAQFVTRMLENDANGDGKLSSDELPERMRGMIDRLDENKDGSVDKAELEAMSRRFGEGRGPGGPGGRERDRDRDRDGNQPDAEAPSRDDL